MRNNYHKEENLESKSTHILSQVLPFLSITRNQPVCKQTLVKLQTVGRLAKATFVSFFVYLCSTNVEPVTKPNRDNNKQIYLNHQLLLTCVVLSYRVLRVVPYYLHW
jgi:hypothetical protein